MKIRFIKIIPAYIGTIIFVLLTNVSLSATEVFLIGDSMAEAVAKPLEKKFADASVLYGYLYKRGTKVDYWINNPEMKSYLTQRNPDYVLITLGTNDLVAHKSNEQIISELNKLIDEIVSLGVQRNGIFLIATPIQNDNDLNNAMYFSFGNHVIVSKTLSLTLKPDNIHPLPESNVIWSDYIFDYLINFPKTSL